MMSRKVLVACAALVSVLGARPASATDLVPDGTDPNAPPPPPPPMPPIGTPGSAKPAPAPASTEAKLAKASEEDTGVGLHFLYVQPEVGIGWASLGSVLPQSGLQSGVGPVIGLGAGAELVALQFGARFRWMPTSNWSLYTVGGEVAYQPGSGRFWPRIGLTVGYAWAGHWDQGVCAPSCDLLDVHGLDLGLRGGVQYFVSSNIELGADAGFDLLLLSRRGINGSTVFAQDASSTGMAASATIHLGWHYP